MTTIRVNSGGSQYTDGLGNVWDADHSFNGGTAYSVGNEITLTNDDPLYQTERWGGYSYTFAVDNGTYDVTLKLAELYQTASGMRVFDVTINGVLVLDNYDIIADIGAQFRAVDKTFVTTVTNSQIVITTTNVVDNAKIGAVEIKPAATGGGESGKLTVPLATGADDGYYDLSSTLYSNAASGLYMGWHSTTYPQISSWLRYAVNIPQGSIISNVNVLLTNLGTAPTASALVNIRVSNEDNATAPVDSPDVLARPRIGTQQWSFYPGQAGTDLRIAIPVDPAPVQAVINRAGWTAGNHILLLFDGTGDSASGVRTFDSVESTDSVPATLEISYVPVGTPSYDVSFIPSDTSSYLEWSIWDNPTATGDALRNGVTQQGAGFPQVTTTVYDEGLVNGPNTRYLRLVDGAGNVTTSSFNVEALFTQTYEETDDILTLTAMMDASDTIVVYHLDAAIVYAIEVGSESVVEVGHLTAEVLQRVVVEGIGGLTLSELLGEQQIETVTSGIDLFGWLHTGDPVVVNALVSGEIEWTVNEVGNPQIIEAYVIAEDYLTWIETEPLVLEMEDGGFDNWFWSDDEDEVIIDFFATGLEQPAVSELTGEVFIDLVLGGKDRVPLRIYMRIENTALYHETLYTSDLMTMNPYTSTMYHDVTYTADIEVIQ